MASVSPLELLSLPVSALENLSQPTVRDLIQYFEPMLLVVPGPRDARGFTRVKHEAPDLPVVHPQLKLWERQQAPAQGVGCRCPRPTAR